MANGKVTLAEPAPCSMWGRKPCQCSEGQVFHCIYTGFAYGPPPGDVDEDALPDGALKEGDGQEK